MFLEQNDSVKMSCDKNISQRNENFILFDVWSVVLRVWWLAAVNSSNIFPGGIFETTVDRVNIIYVKTIFTVEETSRTVRLLFIYCFIILPTYLLLLTVMMISTSIWRMLDFCFLRISSLKKVLFN